jgi:hypothetical protein
MLRGLTGAVLVAAVHFAPTSQYTEYGDKQVYETREGEVCPSYDINVVKHRNGELLPDQCYTVCSAGGYDDCSDKDTECQALALRCAAYDAATDLADSNALCLTLDECSSLCWGMDECIGFEAAVGKDRCFLKLWECAGDIAQNTLLADADYNFLIKQVPWQSSCPLGLTVEVEGGTHGIVEDTYTEREDGSYGAVLGDSRIYWNSCQWVIQLPVAKPHTPAPLSCHDEVEAANFLFGLVNATYNDHICEIAAAAGYCSSSIFKGVCAKTCNLGAPLCLKDNDAAANDLAAIWKVPLSGCGICAEPTQSDVLFGHDDPVVAALCKDTCGMRRLGEVLKRDQRSRKLPTSFAAVTISGIDMEAEALHLRNLLGAGEQWKTFFQTEWPLFGLSPSCSPQSRNVELLNDVTICDAFRLGIAQEGVQVLGVCPLQPGYVTTTGSKCALDHVDVSTMPEVKAERCWDKCKASGSSGEGCDGLMLGDGPATQALCATRSKCEELCTGAAGCVSFDMHMELNRCWLNFNCSTYVADPEYRLVEKDMVDSNFVTTSDAYCELGNVPLADLPKSVSADLCIGPGTSGKCNKLGDLCVGAHCFCDGVDGLDRNKEEDYFALCLSREKCEAACLATPGCLSFDMNQEQSRCYLNTAKGSDCDVVSDSRYEIVDLVPPLPCYPEIEDNTAAYANDIYAPLLDGFVGKYTEKVGDASWTRPGDTTTITWSGCSWDLSEGDVDSFLAMGVSRKFSTMKAGEECATTSAANLAGLTATKMYFGFCPPREGMMMKRVCSDMSICPTLTRCVVTTPRMELEVSGMIKGEWEGFLSVGQVDTCVGIITDSTKFVAKQIASPVRAEYYVDVAKYGPHFHDHAVYRDEPAAPVVYFESFGGAHAVMVKVASNDAMYPANAATELTTLYTISLSYPMQEDVELLAVSDVIRVETFGEGCLAPEDQTVSFKIAAPGVKGLGLYILQTGLVSGESKNFAAFAGDDGLFAVDATVTEPTDFAAFVDNDECAMPLSWTGCSPFSTCTNKVGSYTCTCKAGYKDVGAVPGTECVEEKYECPDVTVKVSNGDMLNFGWRVREMRLYRGETCDEESAVGLTMMGTAREYKEKTTFTGVEIDTYNHPREIVRALQCYTKCGAGEYKGARKLSRARRMQMSPTDWSNCGGNSGSGSSIMKPSSTEDTVLCASTPTCEEVCNQLSDCIGFFQPSAKGALIDKCQLFAAGAAVPTVISEAVEGIFFEKAFKVKLSSSPSDKTHPKELVYDGYGMSHTKDDRDADTKNTEFWSECYDCAPDSAFLEVTVSLSVGPGEPCQIHGLAFWQDPEYMSSSLNVYVGTSKGGLKPTVGLRGAPLAEKSLLSAPFYGAYRYEGESPKTCMSLTCGQTKVLYTGEVIANGAIPNVDSPCLCKQLCLENVQNGCEIWGLYHELDTHSDTPEVHIHKVCYLMGGKWGTAAAQVSTWISDTLGVVLTGASQAGSSVKVTGLHLPSGSSARIKLVDTGDCADPPADTVSGIGCSDSAICSPAPAKVSSTEAVWTGISIKATQEDVEYTVCYCAGPCYAAYQYTPAPGTIDVEGSGFMWTPSATGLDRSSATVDLVVNRPPLHISSTYSNNSDWELKVVPASGDCTANAVDITVTGTDLPAGEFPDNWNDKTFTLTIADAFETAGKYLVCFHDGSDEMDGFIPISSADAMYLDIGLADADLAAPSGLYMNQHFTAMAGATATITLAANELTTAFPDLFPENATIVLIDDCDQEMTDAVLAGKTTAEGSVLTASSIGFAGLVMPTAGRYLLCYFTDSYKASVGTVTVTSRVTTDWVYVLDPEDAGSVEIIGTGLDWKKDRIMITDCQATCGVSSPAKGVTLDGDKSTLTNTNTFVAQNDLFDTEADLRTLVDLPSELRTYTTVKSHYCKDNNIAGAALGDAQKDLCAVKCAVDPTAPGCEGADMASMSALCLPEPACRELCSVMGSCYGIDMLVEADRCYLNVEGPSGSGCATQFEDAVLGPSTAYTFLAKAGSTVSRALKEGGGLSTADVLRFSPVNFESGGSYKVCFCDSSLLPEGQQYCHAESDYDVEIGKLIVSGVSCLLQEKDFRRRECYPQFHGGLACSDEHAYPAVATRRAAGVLPTEQAFP